MASRKGMDMSKDLKEITQEDKGSLMEDVRVEQKRILRFLPKKFKFPGLGIISALLSAFFFSLNTLLVKIIRDVHPIELSLARAGMQFLILLPLLQFKHKKVDILGPRGLRKILWLRGFIGSTAMIFLYLAVDALSLGNAITITYLSMIFVPFVARIFLKESLAVFDIIFAIISLSGVLLIAQPSFIFPPKEGQEVEANEIGILYAVSCAALQAGSMVTIRKLGHETYVPLNVLYYSACGSLTTFIIVFGMQIFQYPCHGDLLSMFTLGCLGLLGQYFLTVALQNERAGTVGVLRSVQIIMVYVLQVTVLGDIPTVLSLIGAALIFSTSIGIGVRKVVNERQRRSTARTNSMARADDTGSFCPPEDQ